MLSMYSNFFEILWKYINGVVICTERTEPDSAVILSYLESV